MKDEQDILFPEYAPPGKRCIGCKFYYRFMQPYMAAAIIQNFEKEGEYLKYRYGQKFCIKNNEFTYFNGYCTQFTKKED